MTTDVFRRLPAARWTAAPLILTGVLLATPALVHGVACPAGGAKLDVCVYNPDPTMPSPSITVSGQFINLEITCTGPLPIVGSYSTSFTVGPGQTYCPPGGIPTNGLLSGMYVHRIQVAGTTQNQYQQSMVLVSSGTRSRIDWTYFPSVITVNVAGAGGAGNCPVNAVSNPAACDLRTAATTAKNIAGTLPVLIQLTTSPGTIPGPVLQLERANLTIDGTDANGNPYIVGDANAAAAGSQDPIARVLDLLPSNAVWIKANNVTLKGLEVRQTLAPNQISGNNLITQFSPFTGTKLDSVRLDAGNNVDCPTSGDPECNNQFSLVRLASRAALPAAPSLTLVNVEGRSAIFKGVDALANNEVALQRSWLRNNYRGNLRANASVVDLDRSVVERGGLRASDDRAMTTTAHGVELTASAGGSLSLDTSANIIRNNRSTGITASGLGDLQPENDAVCGNGSHGLVTQAAGGYIPSLNGLGGIGATYNAGNGVRAGQDEFTAATLDNDSVFASNTQCGLFNTWPIDPVLARNNQWRGSQPFADTCYAAGGGPVDVGTPQDPDTVPIVINSTSPSNAILLGQTLRVMGSGFNAVRGNPLPGTDGCTAGVNTSGSGQGQSCCRKSTRANKCAGVNQPVDGGGNCVELKNSAGTWTELGVKAVTPRLLETEVPTAVFSCLGASDELVRVSKLFDMVSSFDSEPYCTTASPL